MGHKYLRLTLNSLLSAIPPSEIDNIIIMVFIADVDADKRHTLTQTLVARYSDQLNSGLLQVVSVNASVYPPLENLKRNYGDPVGRVKWRSKQVMDFAYMFHYGAPLSQYYIQIEDDVITALNFTAGIRQCIEQHKQWTVLEFSVLGFIGKLFRSDDLERLARFLTMFYDEMPVDFLYIHFMRVLAQQSDTIRCRPSLFQHIGKVSLLASKQPNLLKDTAFLGDSKAVEQATEHALLGDNPPAEVYSTIKHHLDHGPRNAYETADRHFWGVSPQVNDIYCVLFKDSADIDEVEIFTANDAHGGDYLRGGVVLVSPEGQAGPSTEPRFAGQSVCKCQPWVQVGAAFSGDFTAHDVSKTVGFKVKCLQIKVTVNQTEWLIIKHLRVTVAKSLVT
jgi:alpha-1,3-mannosylglycoprotein beta-1,4-N-acetylglucosaminyltransferase C